MDKFIAPLLENNYYHVYNRANSVEKLFYNEGNYDFFLKKFEEYLFGYIELFSFCLLPNHFHMLVKVVKEDSGKSSVSISRAFSNFFNCYSKSINKQENRYGNLFQRPFKRIAIDKDKYLLKVVYYIHQNPIHHGVCKELCEYKWSSYFFITNKVESMINKDELLNWFGGENEFIDLHSSMLTNYKDNYIIE